MTKDYILFDQIDEEEEFELTPFGTNIDYADDIVSICPYCLSLNHQHKNGCIESREKK